MFSNQSSGGHLPHWEEVVVEEAVVEEVEVEVGEVEDHQADQTQPSNQWCKLRTSEQWGRYPKTSLEIERKPMTSLKK
jgi:hypothetical protein